MLLGAEANIAEDGTIDVTPGSVPVLDTVVASVHTDLRSAKDQTARLVRAVETPGVAVLGHPKGRLYNMRTGVKASWDRVFSAAAGRGVAIEINGCPERQDLPPSLARTALGRAASSPSRATPTRGGTSTSSASPSRWRGSPASPPSGS